MSSMVSTEKILEEIIDLIESGNTSRAINRCKYILDIDPSNQNALYFASLAYKNLEDPVNAITLARRILIVGNISDMSRKKVNDIIHWSIKYANVLIERKEYGSAWFICSSAISIDPDNFPAITAISLCEASIGNPLKALGWIPNSSPITKEVAEICNLAITASNKMLERGNMEGFLSLISEVSRILPENEAISKKVREAASTILTKAIELHQSGSLEMAEAYYNFILSTNIEQTMENHLRFLKLIADERRSVKKREMKFRNFPAISQKNEKILTICIPTYNRDIKVLFQLENVFFQIVDGRIDDVSILVFDNCSIDNTKDLIERFIIENDPKNVIIQYRRNNKNIGFDGNVVSCFNEANSKYVWFLSDDDYAENMCVKKIVISLKEIKSTLFFLGKSLPNGAVSDYISFTTPYGRVVSLSSEKTYLVSKQDEEMRAALSAHCTWVSSFIVKKTITDIATGSFHGTAAAHIGIVSLALYTDDSPSVAYLGYPLVKNFPHTVFSSNFLEYFVSGLVKVFETPELGYSTEISRGIGRANMPFLDNFIYTDRPDMRTSYRFKPLYLIKKKMKYGCSMKEIFRFSIAVIKIYIKYLLSSYSRKNLNIKPDMKGTNI